MDESLGAAYREAQMSVIGSVLIDPAALGPVMDRVAVEHFEGEYRTVFDAVRRLWGRQQPVDGVTVLGECGDSYEPLLRRCMTLTPTAANAAAYADLVRAQSRLLKLRDAGVALAGALDEAEARQALKTAEELLMQRNRPRVFSMQSLLVDFYQSMSGPAPKYLPWGIRQLDEALTCELGDLVILGADSSVGKTALATQVAWHMAGKGYRVGFFSGETRSGKLTQRIVAQRAGIPTDAIKHRTYEDKDFRAVLDLGNGVSKFCLDIIEASGFSVEDIRAATVAGGYQVIFIDYVQLLSGEGEKRSEVVAGVSIDLHILAQDLGVTVVALSQITPADKSVKARRSPGKEDLRESRQLIHDADIILMMSLADPDNNESLRWLNCKKNKEGSLPSVCLKFDPTYMTFTATDSRVFIPRAARARTFRELDDPQEEIPWTT